MPAIRIVTSAKLNDHFKQNIAQEASLICAKTLGKPVSVVETIVVDGATIAFGGDCAQPAAFVNIGQIGEFTEEQRQSFTQSYCALLAQHGIPAKRIYLHFSGETRDKWGWL